MTHPMPGPHDCTCRYAPCHVCADPTRVLDPGCLVHGEAPEDKHLTDAECAAEYWRAEAAYWTAQAMERSPHHAAFEADVFERFAAYPHALEEA